MNDLISRQAAIDAIMASTSKYTGFMEMEMYTDDDAVEAINGVPSAQTERKKGEWILKPNIYGVAYCSECDYELHTDNTNYCPNCGADMREMKEE